MSTVEERFTAAVNVIRGLPKNGSYQPSNEMMLKFYSYFKQGTLGPCTQKKPAFWDVVNRAKWDAYKRLGTMSKEQAMECYVDELKKIIETMSYTDNVANFMGSISELEGVNVNDLEVIAPEAIKKVKSQPNSPFASRESSPIRTPMLTNGNGNGHVNGNGALINYENGNGVPYLNGGYTLQNGHTIEQSDDEYIDTVDDESDMMSIRSRISNASHHNSRSKSRHNIMNDFPTTITTNEQLLSRNDNLTIIDVLTQLNSTVERMNKDLQHITTRIDSVEKTFIETIKVNSLARTIANKRRQHPSWWPFDDISPNWFVFMIVWPFFAQKLVRMMQRKK